MRHYCRILVDRITGEPHHMTVSTEPLNEGVGVWDRTGVLEMREYIIGTPEDGLPKQRAADLFPKIQGNSAKQILFKDEVPIDERPEVKDGQEAKDIIRAREIATGRREP